MSPHAVARDRSFVSQLEGQGEAEYGMSWFLRVDFCATHHWQLARLQHIGKLLDDMVVHVVVLAPGCFRCIDVEAGA